MCFLIVKDLRTFSFALHCKILYIAYCVIVFNYSNVFSLVLNELLSCTKVVIVEGVFMGVGRGEQRGPWPPPAKLNSTTCFAHFA